MRYLLDFSTLQSAYKGLSSYGFPNYLKEAGGTEGLTQLLDLARLVDIFVLSDEILVSHRTSQADIPTEMAQVVSFVPLETSSSYFDDLKVYIGDFENVKRALDKTEGLLGSQFTKDFLNEIEHDLTIQDYQYVEMLGDQLSALTSLPIIRLFNQKSQDTCKLIARTFQYLQTANSKAVPYICHAYRSPIVRTFHPPLTKSLPNLYSECEDKLKKWLIASVGRDRFEFHLPMFFLAVLKESNHPDDLFKVASQLRQSDGVVQLRILFSEIVDENNRFRPLRYLELQRIADEQSVRFKRRYTSQHGMDNQEPASVELSISPTSIVPEASVNLLKASRSLVRWLTEWNDRRGIAVIFKVARKTYEVVSLEEDVKRLWGVQLTERHKDLLRQISQHCDT
jgi:hypothetical protein